MHKTLEHQAPKVRSEEYKPQYLPIRTKILLWLCGIYEPIVTLIFLM